MVRYDDLFDSDKLVRATSRLVHLSKASPQYAIRPGRRSLVVVPACVIVQRDGIVAAELFVLLLLYLRLLLRSHDRKAGITILTKR